MPTPLSLAKLLMPEGMTNMARRNFRWELRAALLFPLAVACVEGNILGVLVAIAFDASPLVVAILGASTAMANFTGFLWSSLLHGRDRVRFTSILQLGVVACAASIAIVPFPTSDSSLAPFSPWIVAGFALMARILMAGIVTARADLWGANYAGPIRARVASRIAMMVSAVVSVSAVFIGLMMDATHPPENPQSTLTTLQQIGAWLSTMLDPILGEGDHAYRPVFLMAAVAGMIGAALFSRIRWRGGAGQISAERKTTSESGSPGPRAMIAVLRSDRDYRRYMTAQYILGVSNLAAIPMVVVALKDVFQRDYTESLLLTQAIPMIVPVVTLPLWARMIDGMHIVRFRSMHTWILVLTNLLLALGFTMQIIQLVYAAQAVRGLAMAGGMLAWNLGHHDFASRELANVYMGIHTTLTGIRGAGAPIVGAFLYTGIALTPSLPELPPIGPMLFYISAAGTAFSGVLFIRLAMELGANTKSKQNSD
ncbi:MAG: hypothetical protein AAGB34_04450 [Planctomycetota bacterium]